MSEDAITFEVDAVPATFATSGERPWKDAVRAAALTAMVGREQRRGRFAVEMDFVLPVATQAGQGWDLDNLIKPTIDALAGVIGERVGNWRSAQADDERVDEIRATKRTVSDGERPGARVTVRLLRAHGGALEI